MIVQTALKNLSNRDQLGPFLNKLGMVGKGVEVGTLHGANAEDLIKKWNGHLYCVDLWRNQDGKVYFDSANKLNMDEVFAGACKRLRSPKCTLLRMTSLDGSGKFEDGELDFCYLDANHAVDAVRADISAWWPKVKIGGIIGGHDCNTRYDHETNSDAATAVLELCEAIGVRPHLTWCTSWWIQKTEELDHAFREASLAGKIARPVYTDNRDIDCVVVLPVAQFDWNLAVKFLTWWKEMLRGQPNPHPVIAWCSPDLTGAQRDELGDSGLPNLSIVVAKDVKEMGYFGSPNQVFKTALEFCEREWPGRAMLWAEADAVPMRPTWVDEIMAEYRDCGRPFMGDIHRDGPVPHLTGNAVYHPNWRQLAPAIAALGKEACGWDSLCAHDILPRSHRAKTIQQIWRPILPITAAWARANIRPTTALFHQCKDGSLIDILSAQSGIQIIPLKPALCQSSYATDKAKMGSMPVPSRASVIGGNEAHGKTHIMITSCKRDVEFTGHLIRSIMKFASGFSGVTLVIPEADARFFGTMVIPKLVKVVQFKEEPGKGFLHHMIQICRADELCPDADFIVHVDPDCMFWKPSTPADFVIGGKCLLVREHYDIVGPRQPNRLNWRGAVEAATGIIPEYDTMVRHPNVYPRAIYGHLRSLVEKHTKTDFNTFVFSRQNSFPQGFCEYVSLGTVGLRDFPDAFHVVDYDYEKDGRECGVDKLRQYIYRPERDKIVEGFSYQPARYRQDWNRFMHGLLPKFYVK